MKRVECPLCKQTAQIASISHFLFAHLCPVTHTWWYTNGVLWSQSMQEVTPVERKRQEVASGDAGA